MGKGRPYYGEETAGTASLESQIKYLQKVLQIKNDRIASLEGELLAAGLGDELRAAASQRHLEALAGLQRDLSARQKPYMTVKKRVWWKLWRV